MYFWQSLCDPYTLEKHSGQSIFNPDYKSLSIVKLLTCTAYQRLLKCTFSSELFNIQLQNLPYRIEIWYNANRLFTRLDSNKHSFVCVYLDDQIYRYNVVIQFHLYFILKFSYFGWHRVGSGQLLCNHSRRRHLKKKKMHSDGTPPQTQPWTSRLID